MKKFWKMYGNTVWAAVFGIMWTALVVWVVVLVLTSRADAENDGGGLQQAGYIENTPEIPRPTIAEYDMEQEDYENRLIEEALLARAYKIENCKITYYCCERYNHICGTGDGITALGNEVLPGVSCAVPKSIPLGSTVMIDWGDGEIEYRRADDRGDAVNGNHIDLAVPTHREALELGVDYATVYWVEEDAA